MFLIPRSQLLFKLAATAVLLPWVIAAQAQPSTDDQAIADNMRRLADDVQLLLPFIYDSDQPLTPGSRALIASSVKDMQTHVEKIATTVAPRSDTYQISYEVIASQLEQAQTELTQGRESYAVNLLGSAISVCATCHTQDDQAAAWLAPTVSVSTVNPFSNAEFLFMTRQYDRAFDAYKNWLHQQQTLADDNRTRSAFERLLLTALQIQKSSAAIHSLIAELSQGGNISATLKQDVLAWLDGLGELEKRTDIGKQPNRNTLKNLAETWLDGNGNESPGHIFLPETQRPQIVWLRGQLYRALNQETDASRVPQWLYWLAVSDRLLEYRFYYSLADMYLKQCMLEYTENPVARRCYGEYENYLLFFYSGSSGTHLPEDIKSELEMLKARVFGSGGY